MKRAHRIPVAVALIALAALVLAACGGERKSGGDDAKGGRLSIATGNSTGVYYVLGGAIADQINKHLKGYRATAEETGASVENVQRVVNGDSDLAFSLADTAQDAVKGTGPFEGKGKQPIRALLRPYSNYTQVVVRTSTGIRSIEDMKGKTVSTGAPQSGTELIAHRLLEAAGLDAGKDIKAQKLALDETTAGMKEGSIDAMFWSGGLPTAGLKDLMASGKSKYRFLDLSSYLPKLQDRYGDVYQRGSVAKDAYGLDADVPSVVVPNLLIVKDTMSDALAEKLTKLVYDHKKELVQVHAEAEHISPGTGARTGDVALHPGAQKYFDGLK